MSRKKRTGNKHSQRKAKIKQFQKKHPSIRMTELIEVETSDGYRDEVKCVQRFFLRLP